MPTPDQTGDFTITSPPYRDIEYAGDEPEQRWRTSATTSFSPKASAVMREKIQFLKPGASPFGA